MNDRVALSAEIRAVAYQVVRGDCRRRSDDSLVAAEQAAAEQPV